MEAKTELQKMLTGEHFNSQDAELTKMRNNAEKLYKEYNTTTEEDIEKRQDIYKKLFGGVGNECSIRAPFYCDYGKNIYLGNRVYMNFNCCILDCANVYIGDCTLFAPGVQVYAVNHPTDVEGRNSGVEYAKEIRIGKNVWVGGNAIILPGVTIGDNTTIGAGSVVTKDIPANCVAVGNPCKVLRYLNKEA
jgi:maltose O-acetyltransferase